MTPTWPCHLLLCCLLARLSLANTEKTIFIAPPPLLLPDTQPTLDALNLHVLSPESPSARLPLARTFPEPEVGQGLHSWYLLNHMNPGQRYELRLCWAATQPTQFSIDHFTLSEVFDTPDLIQSLANFSESSQPSSLNSKTAGITGNHSLLFLRITAAADFFTADVDLMTHPPPVLVDLILDPFLLNIFPASLVPTAIYTTIVAAVSVLAAGSVNRFLDHLRIASKPHVE